MSVTRRRFLSGSALSMAAVPFADLVRPWGRFTGQSAPRAAGPFRHGVASGDPRADRVLLWTRVSGDTTSEVPVRWTLASNPALTRVVARGDTRTGAARDFTVKVDVTGLAPATTCGEGANLRGAHWRCAQLVGLRSAETRRPGLRPGERPRVARRGDRVPGRVVAHAVPGLRRRRAHRRDDDGASASEVSRRPLTRLRRDGHHGRSPAGRLVAAAHGQRSFEGAALRERPRVRRDPTRRRASRPGRARDIPPTAYFPAFAHSARAASSAACVSLSASIA